MTQTYLRGTTAAVHRIDLPCALTGFTTPPCAVQLKVLPSSPLPGEDRWTLLAHAAPGKPDQLARWLRPHPGVSNVCVEPGIAPKLLRATLAALPAQWTTVATFVKVHHLDLAADGNAAWFIEGAGDQILALVRHLEAGAGPQPLGATDVRCHPVGREVSITRRQVEALATAVSLGYYEIPHRLDLRALAARTGLSLGAVSELLRRAEAAVLTHYIDARLVGWPFDDQEQESHHSTRQGRTAGVPRRPEGRPGFASTHRRAREQQQAGDPHRADQRRGLTSDPAR